MSPELFFVTFLPFLVVLAAVYLFSADYAPTLSFAGPMLSAMSTVEPTASSTAPSTAVVADQDDDDEGTNDFHPFDARELPNVLDRVVTPVLVDVPGVFHGEVSKAWDERWGVHVLMADDSTVSLDYAVMCELVGPVTVLDAPREVLAYYADGELLCADHGAPFDIGLSDGAVSPIFENLYAVEYCSHHFGPGNYGHSFCGSCGAYVEPKGHPDSGFNGPFFVCDNCSTQAVYVDGDGYQYVDGFDDLTDDYNVTVTLDAAQRTYPFGWSSRLNPVPSGTVTAVLDASGRRWTASWGFVCYLDDDPTAGTVLILAESTNGAWDEAVNHFEDDHAPDTSFMDDDEADGAIADFHASLQMIRVRLGDAVTISTK